MKQITLKLRPQWILISISLLLSSILIWYAGPSIYIENSYPLALPAKRIFCIFTLFLVVAFIKWLSMGPDADEVSVTDSKEMQNKLQVLKGRFLGAIQFLKKNTITKKNKSIQLSKLPWMLLIGPQSAGKTSFLANASVNYALVKQFRNEKIMPSESCDWWATKDVVIVDVPGDYLKDTDHYLWKKFLTLLKRYRGKNGVNAIVLALPLPELIKKSNLPQKKQLVAEIKTKIQQLHTQFNKRIPVYFVITKCDLLPGFGDFFAECSTEELAQAWGIVLPTFNPKEHDSLLELFVERFNALIKKINSQLITKLHAERNANVRPAIKDFPLQLEKLKETISNFLKALGTSDLRLHGIYLTSALQSLEEIKPAEPHSIHSGNQQGLQLLRSPAMPSKAYFIRQVLLQGLMSSGDAAKVKKERFAWKRSLTYVTSGIFLLVAVVLLGRDFKQSIFLTYSIQHDLAAYQLSMQQNLNDKNHFLKLLPLLDSLAARSTISNTSLSKLTHLLSFYSDKSQKTASEVYAQALQTIVMPEVKNIFENYLKNPTDPSQTYAVLKAYLMLDHRDKLEINYVVKTLQMIAMKDIDEPTKNGLIHHVSEACKHTQLTLDANLITDVRGQLFKSEKLDLAFIILQNIDHNNEAMNIDFIDPNIFDTHVGQSIPVLYTANLIPTVLTQEITQAAQESIQGNWVLGQSGMISNDNSLNSFVQELRERYLNSYIALWESILNDTKMTAANSLAQTDAMISSITSNTSPMLLLLKTIKQNTSFAPILTASSKLNSLNSLLANAHSEQENTLYNVFVSLRKLHFYLESIVNSADVSRAAFEAAKNRELNATGDPIAMVHLLAQQNSEPMRSWLNNLATQSWHFILQEASRHIENQWQVSVMTIYKSQILNQELDMQQFMNFAGKQGTLNNFYERFLQPFITEDASQWKSVENQKLPISPAILTQLQQVSKVQNLSRYTLFTQGQRNPLVQHFQLPERLVDEA